MTQPVTVAAPARFRLRASYAERSAGGQHIIDDSNMAAIEIALHHKCTADVFAPCLPRQTGLRRGIPGLDAQGGLQRNLHRLCNAACQFQRLIESALA